MRYIVSGDVINALCVLWAHMEVDGFDVCTGTDSAKYVPPL